MSEKRSMTESQKPPNALTAFELARDLAVDEVEDVGDDHDHAGGDEAAEAERPGRRDVDEHADERQDVGWIRSATQARMISAQREHADAAR